MKFWNAKKMREKQMEIMGKKLSEKKETLRRLRISKGYKNGALKSMFASHPKKKNNASDEKLWCANPKLRQKPGFYFARKYQHWASPDFSSVGKRAFYLQLQYVQQLPSFLFFSKSSACWAFLRIVILVIL